MDQASATLAERPSRDPIVPHAIPLQELARSFSSDLLSGLTDARAAELQSAYGVNELAEVPPTPLWRKLMSQFADLMNWILIVAAVISGLLGEWVDALAIVAIVLLNSAIGFMQEEKAGRALAALRKLSAPLAKVIRGGLPRSLPARELVPGDLIELEAGDYIPADARLAHAYGFQVQEAALTGESVPVLKDAERVPPPQTALADRRNMVYMGTIAASGKARAMIVATGMQTELGRIAGLLERHEEEPTPLQRRLAELGRVLIVICLAIVLLIFVLQLLRGGRLAELFLIAVSLAVAAVPEGLPAVVTVALAVGLQRMVKRNALIRRLPSVETLGSVTVICSDKTGTLTRNEMTVREIEAGGTRYHVTGAGYVPRGQFLRASEGQHEAHDRSQVETVNPSGEPDLMHALRVAALCNNARLCPVNDGSSWQVMGDPTEGALLSAAMKAGMEADLDGRRLIHEIPFDSTRKMMSVVIQDSAAPTMYSKGAAEAVLANCVAERRAGEVVALTEPRRQAILAVNSQLAAQSLRVLALAYCEQPCSGPTGYQEKNLIFTGLAGMIDPPREEVKDAIRKCREAGIRPVMITGDHPATALAIARELQLAESGQEAITGQQLDSLTDEDLEREVDRIAVYARVSAEHKLRVVRAWKRRGHVVAMTGDGVNDAPAVKAADIGIAMGLTGTDVTKEASDMVLTDDNFASIVNAVEEGRGIFDNIRKVLLYLLSCNFGEILLMLVASLLGWPAPLLPIQLLWINLVTDGLPALALSLEPPEPGIMRRRPRPPRESILSRQIGWSIVVQGALVGAVGLIAFGVKYLADPSQPHDARAMAFCVLVYSELLRSLAARSQTLTLGKLGLLTNPYLLLAIAVSGLLQLSIVATPLLQPVFGIAGHPAWDWTLIVLLSLTPVTIIEVVKLLRAHIWPAEQ